MGFKIMKRCYECRGPWTFEEGSVIDFGVIFKFDSITVCLTQENFIITFYGLYPFRKILLKRDSLCFYPTNVTIK